MLIPEQFGPHLVLSFRPWERQELVEKIRSLPPESVAEVEHFVDSLIQRESTLDHTSLHEALANYAIQHAGTDADLDPALEAAAIDHLII